MQKLGPRRFANQLRLSIERLNWLVGHVERYYYEYEIAKTYDDGTPQLDSKGEVRVRKITASQGLLKRVQKSIKIRYFRNGEWPPYVHGGIKGRDIISNARSHLGLPYHFVTDIKDFFPTISEKNVFFVYFDVLDLTPNAARIATILTTYKQSLPQGTPTSPYLANQAFRSVDTRLMDCCRASDITYTRYVDDLVFSSRRDFADQVPMLIGILRRNGYRISRGRKTFYKIGSVVITGVLVRNGVLAAPDEKRAKLAQMDPLSRSYQGLQSHIQYIELDGNCT